jgi:hypothetical protein
MEESQVAERVLMAAIREVGKDFTANVGEPWVSSEYVADVSQCEISVGEAVLIATLRDVGTMGTTSYLTIYANSYGWGPNAPETLQLKRVTIYAEGEPHDVVIRDPETGVVA